MTVVTTIDVYDVPNSEHRSALDRMGVEARPELVVGLPGARR